MAMEKNPPRSTDPEQPRDITPSHSVDALLVDKLLSEAETFLQPDENDFKQAVDIEKLSDFLREAYDVDIGATSAHIEITRFSCDLSITLSDDSCLMYRMDNGITETTTEATVGHLVKYIDSKAPELINTKDMETSELVVFVRALDSIKASHDTTLE